MAPDVRIDLGRAQVAEGYHALSVYVLAAASALLTCEAFWIAWPRPNQEWRIQALMLGLLCAMGPLHALMVSLHALRSKRTIDDSWTSFLIKLIVRVPVVAFLIVVPLADFGNDGKLLGTDSLVPLLLGLVILVVMAVVGAIRLTLPRFGKRWKNERRLHRVTVASVIVPLAVLTVWSGFSALLTI